MLQMHLHHPLWLFPLLAAVGGGGASGRGSSRHQGSRYQDYHQLGGAEGGGRHRQDRQTQDGSRIELQTKVKRRFAKALDVNLGSQRKGHSNRSITA